MERHRFAFQDKQPGGNLTVSVGAACCSAANAKKDDLIKKADHNLYLAKSGGRNRVVI